MKMKNKLNILLLISLLLFPISVFASNGEAEIPILAALFMEAFISIHMSLFVLKPLSEMFGKENSKDLFWKMFLVRVGILLFFDAFVTTMIAIVDFLAVFVGAFFVVPICSSITKTKINGRSNQVIKTANINTATTPVQNPVSNVELRCAKCNALLKVNYKFCANCGAPFEGDNVKVVGPVQVAPKELVNPSNFDSIYRMSDDQMLEAFIKKELTKAGFDTSAKLVSSDFLKRKRVLNIIFAILIFIYVSLIFFHFPVSTYLLGLCILVIFFVVTRKYDFMKAIKKQVKARPQEKISNIVMNYKSTLTTDNSRGVFVISILAAVILPFIIFSTPKIIYEKVEGGYGVRYYAFGLTNFKTATIPDSHNGEKVVSLRGNTFSNMPFLESVTLPDTIVEIRGQAFKNCYKLEKVNIPENLEYLGGAAFYNAESLKSVYLPDSLTYLGGESFYGARSLESVRLSENLTEIRGDSFEYCTSLKSITIPDKVTRIGGHAFYGDTSLSKVEISENSKLSEIGSSAFRQCSSLYEITIPSGTYVNERAFKESPTSVSRYDSYGRNNSELTTEVKACDSFDEKTLSTGNVNDRIYPCGIYYIDELEVKVDRYKEDIYKYTINENGNETDFFSNDSVDSVYLYNNKAIKIRFAGGVSTLYYTNDVLSNGIDIDMFDSTIVFRDVNSVIISLKSVDRVVNGTKLPADKDHCVSLTKGYADKYIYNFEINMNSLITELSIDDLEEHEIYNFLKIKNTNQDMSCPKLKVFIK